MFMNFCQAGSRWICLEFVKSAPEIEKKRFGTVFSRYEALKNRDFVKSKQNIANPPCSDLTNPLPDTTYEWVPLETFQSL